jgi:hypothetical protein
VFLSDESAVARVKWLPLKPILDVTFGDCTKPSDIK